MLEEGDIIELKEGMRVYAEVPEHFLYSNRRGVRPAGAAGRQAMSAKIQPVAWAVYADSFGDDGPAVCKHREVSERLAREVGGRLVPLLAPDFAPQAPDFAPQAPDNGNATLTDAEREAVDMAIDLLNGVEDVSAGASSRADAAAATLRGLLERLG